MVRWASAPSALADGFDAGDVLVDVAVHLDLEIAIALVEELLGLFRHFGRRLDRDDAQHRHGRADLAAEQVVERHAERARAEVVQGAVDAGLGLAAAGQRAVEFLQDRLDGERVLAEHVRLEAFELVRQRFEGRAHMRRGVRISVAGVPLVGADANDPPARCRCGAERKLPVLVLQRHHAGLELDAFDFHVDLICSPRGLT